MYLATVAFGAQHALPRTLKVYIIIPTYRSKRMEQEQLERAHPGYYPVCQPSNHRADHALLQLQRYSMFTSCFRFCIYSGKCMVTTYISKDRTPM